MLIPLLEQFKARRAELNLSNAKIAQLANLPPATVYNIFNGDAKNPSLITIGALCAVLGVSLDALFGIVDPDMSDDEVERVRAEYAETKAALDKRIEEHAQNILLNEVTIESDRKLIAALEDRVKFQKIAIWTLRGLIVAFAAYGLAMDAMNPDIGIIQHGLLDALRQIF